MQWFRQEAAMYRAIEQVEAKHAEFERVIQYHNTLSCVWTRLAEESNEPGEAAYARQNAAVYVSLHEATKNVYNDPKLAAVLANRAGTFVERAVSYRQELLSWMLEAGMVSEEISLCTTF